jgi:hypothetical protein
MKKLAIISIMASACAALLPGCQRRVHADAAWWAAENQRIHLENQRNLLKLRLGNQTVPPPGSGQAADRSSLVASLTKQAQTLRDRINRLESDIARHRMELIRDARNEAIGSVVGSLTTNCGKTYRDATITRIDDGGVSIRHHDGSARLDPASLPHEMVARLGLDRDARLDVIAAELAAEYQWHQWLENQPQRSNSRIPDAPPVSTAHLHLAIPPANHVSPLAEPPRHAGRVHYRRSRAWPSHQRRYYHAIPIPAQNCPPP